MARCSNADVHRPPWGHDIVGESHREIDLAPNNVHLTTPFEVSSRGILARDAERVHLVALAVPPIFIVVRLRRGGNNDNGLAAFVGPSRKRAEVLAPIGVVESLLLCVIVVLFI